MNQPTRKKILLVCYYFPPLGMGGIWRPLNLFNFLPEHGYECHILTVKNVLYRSYEKKLFDNLDKTKIFRAGSYDPQRLLYIFGKRNIKASTINSTRNISEKYFPDSKVGWVGPAIRMGKKLFEKFEYDAVISSAPPISTHLIAQQLSHIYSVPWIADFRDYWTAFPLEESFKDQKNIDKGKKLLAEIKRQADITTVNNVIADYLGQGEVISNGFDLNISEGWRKKPSDKKFTIGLLGHQLESFEIESLFELLKKVNEKYPEVLKNTRLIHVGQMNTDWFESHFSKYKINIESKFFGHLPRDKTIETLADTHLFHFGLNTTDKADFLPGKTFDLLASGRPVFVNAPMNGEVWKILNPSDQSYFLNALSDADVINTFKKIYDSVFEGSYAFNPISDYAKSFSSYATVKKFASFMDKLT